MKAMVKTNYQLFQSYNYKNFVTVYIHETLEETINIIRVRVQAAHSFSMIFFKFSS